MGHGYTAGSVSAYSIPFMLEMAVNPVSTSGNAIGAKLMRYAVRKFGLNVAGKALRKKAVKAAVKYGIADECSGIIRSSNCNEWYCARGGRRNKPKYWRAEVRLQGRP